MWQENTSWKQGLLFEVTANHLSLLADISAHNVAIAVFRKTRSGGPNTLSNLVLDQLLYSAKDVRSVLSRFGSRDNYLVAVDLRVRTLELDCTVTTLDHITSHVTTTLEYKVTRPDLVLHIEDPISQIQDRVCQTVQDLGYRYGHQELGVDRFRQALLGLEIEQALGILLQNVFVHSIQWSEEVMDFHSEEAVDKTESQNEREKIKIDKLHDMGITDPTIIAHILNSNDEDYRVIAERIAALQQQVAANDEKPPDIELLQWLIDKDYVTRADAHEIIEPLLQRLRISAVGEENVPLDKVFFTAFYPREIQSAQRYGMYVYAHTENALVLIEDDIRKFEDELGGGMPKPRTAKNAISLVSGTSITVIPECDGLEFNPPSLTKIWHGPWTRFGFDFQNSVSTEDDIASGRISILIQGIEIAQIKFAVEFLQAPSHVHTKAINPLAAAKFARTAPTRLYDRIFVSYSREDKPVVEVYRLAQLALGNEVFVDTYSIRTGENWRAALASAIDQANVFQLFWSKNSAESSNVRDEWDYALNHKCAADQCVEFIRPVYWEKPLPVTPPHELAHLNFRYVPLTQEKEME